MSDKGQIIWSGRIGLVEHRLVLKGKHPPHGKNAQVILEALSETDSLGEKSWAVPHNARHIIECLYGLFISKMLSKGLLPELSDETLADRALPPMTAWLQTRERNDEDDEE